MDTGVENVNILMFLKSGIVSEARVYEHIYPQRTTCLLNMNYVLINGKLIIKGYDEYEK